MEDAFFDVMRLAGQGLCCSQILMALALEDRGETNPGLIRAMSGLGNGVGDCSQTCGALTGGACVLGLYAGAGSDKPAHDAFASMQTRLTDWFIRHTAQYGGTRCMDILDGRECGGPDPQRCGALVLDVRNTVLSILAENGLSPEGNGEYA